MGYFFYDMVYAEIFEVHDSAMRFHHVSVLFGGSIVFFRKIGGSVGVCKDNLVCVMLTEISNPFMQLRAIYKSKREESSFVFRLSELAFAILFSFNRGIIGTLLLYNIWTSQIGLDFMICVSAIYSVGLFWIYIIASLILKRFRTQDGKIAQPWVTLAAIVNFFKRRLYVLIIAIFLWSFMIPVVLTQLLKTQSYVLKVGSFNLV